MVPAEYGMRSLRALFLYAACSRPLGSLCCGSGDERFGKWYDKKYNTKRYRQTLVSRASGSSDGNTPRARGSGVKYDIFYCIDLI